MRDFYFNKNKSNGGPAIAWLRQVGVQWRPGIISALSSNSGLLTVSVISFGKMFSMQYLELPEVMVFFAFAILKNVIYYSIHLHHHFF